LAPWLIRPWIHQSVSEILRNTGIHRCSSSVIFSEPPTGFRGGRRACSVADVFSGVVTTQLTRGGKLCMHLEA